MKKPAKDIPLENPAKTDWATLLAIVVRVALGVIFAVSGFFKLIHPVEEFAATIESYRMMHPALILPAARILPWIEWFAGFFLITGYLTRAAAIVSGIMNCLFILALASTMLRGINIGECGCFGELGPHLKVWQAIILDSFMLSGGIFLVKRRFHLASLDQWIEKV